MRTFDEDMLLEFFKLNRLERMIRVHSVIEGGYRWCFDGKLLSLFSSFNYDGMENSASVAVVEGDGIELFKL